MNRALPFLKKYRYSCTALAATLVVLGPMLLPGYILSLDLVFTPSFHFSYTPGDFINSLPLWYLLQGLYAVFPGWVVEKLLLVSLVFTLCYCSLRFLPVPKRFSVQLFASLLYTANLFVYGRMLGGQWAVLFAYALLPLVLCLALSWTASPTYKKSVGLAGALALVCIFSLQVFIMGVLMAAGWALCTVGYRKPSVTTRTKLYASAGVFLGALIVCTSYWTIPAMHRSAPIESAFTAEHWTAFAASGNGHVAVLLNIAALGGFWDEGDSWANYFAWPQQHALFWISCAGLAALVCMGIYSMWRQGSCRLSIFLILLGALAYILSTGAAATPLQAFNIFLYSHAPFWSGFRDSQKFVALLALVYATVAGWGFEAVVSVVRAEKPRMAPYIAALLFCIPIFFGMFVWFGFARELPAVQYPPSWSRAKAELQAHPEAKALILPWQGYFSLGFDRNLIVANPAEQFFGPQAVLSQNVRLGQVYDQSSDPAYLALDHAVRHNNPASGQTMAEFLQGQGVRYVIYFQDIRATDTFTYQFLASQGFTLEWSTPELQFYMVK